MPQPDFRLQSRRFKQITKKLQECKNLWQAIGTDYAVDGKEDHSALCYYYYSTLEGYTEATLHFASVISGTLPAEELLKQIVQISGSETDIENSEDSNNGSTDKQL